MKIVLKCPNGHELVIDEEKSSENWVVYVDPCPECGTKLEMGVE